MLLKLSNKFIFSFLVKSIIPIIILIISPNIVLAMLPKYAVYPILYAEFISGTSKIILVIKLIKRNIMIFFSLLHIIFIFTILSYIV